MKFRNTLLAVLLLAALGSFIYYYEYKGEAGREKAAQEQKTLLAFDKDKVSGVEIARPGQPAISLARESGRWKVTAPVATRADDDKVAQLLTTLGFLQVEEEIPDVPEADLEGFGLGASALRLTLQEGDAGGKSLLLGGKTAVGNNYYARRGDAAAVLVVSGGADQLVTTDLAAVRFKKVVGIDSFKLKRFQIDRGAVRVAVAHQDSAWRLEAPQPFPADGGKVQGLWFDVQSWEAEAFPAEAPAPSDLAAHGLDRPVLTLTVEAQELDAPLHVEFGRPSPNGDVFARRSDLPAIMKVKSETFDKLSGSLDAPNDLRDARVAPTDRWKIASLELLPAGAATPTVLVKDDEAKWRWGAKDGREMPEDQVNALLDAIEGLKATGYVDRPTAADQRETVLTVTLRESGETSPPTWTFRLGALGRTDGEARRALSSAAAPLYLVPDGEAVALLEKSRGLKEPEAAPATAASDPNNPPVLEH